ncbi:TPA: hypothetical protein ACN36J_001393 [Vibrio parahaemolyticus]
MQSNEIKHIFLVSRTDYFSPLFIDALIEKAGINHETLGVVVFGCGDIESQYPKKIDGVTYFSYEKVNNSIFLNASTITYFSLSALNSSQVREVLELSPQMKSKCYMFITDDEVDRWLWCKDKHGRLVADVKLNITENDLWVLSQQEQFIALDSAFREKLSQVLERCDFCLVDSSVVFDTLPTKSAETLAISVYADEKNKKKSILLGTKPNAFKYQDIKAMLHAFIKAGVHTEYKFVVMWPVKQWRKRLLLDLYLTYLQKIKKQTVDVSVITSLPPLAYTAVVMSCTHLVLQPRGGASTARQLMKWGQGKVYVAKGSHNELFFKDAQNIELCSFSTFDELASSLGKQIDVKANASKINAEEQRSLQELATLYS